MDTFDLVINRHFNVILSAIGKKLDAHSIYPNVTFVKNDRFYDIAESNCEQARFATGGRAVQSLEWSHSILARGEGVDVLRLELGKYGSKENSGIEVETIT